MMLESVMALDAEVERLRAELEKAYQLLSQMVGWQRDAEIAKAKLQIELDGKDAEVERLRALNAELLGLIAKAEEK